MKDINKNINEYKNQIEIAARLKVARMAKSFTQEEMAKLMDISYHSYIKMENAKVNITINNLIKIRNILNISTDMLLFGDTGIDNLSYENYIDSISLISMEGIKSFDDFLEYFLKLKATLQCIALNKQP